MKRRNRGLCKIEKEGLFIERRRGLELGRWRLASIERRRIELNQMIP